MADLDLTPLRTRSARLARLVSILAACLWVLLLAERFGAVGLRLVEHGGDAASLRAFAAQAIAAIPDALYLFALDGVRRALGAIARGEFFTPTLTRMLERVGTLLAAAAIIAVFVVPALQRLVGAGPGYWIAFDISALVLGALGLALTILAGVVGQAARLKAELDEIF